MNEFNVQMTREQLTWLYRQLDSGKEKAAAVLKTKFTGELSTEQEKEQREVQKHFDELDTLTKEFLDSLNRGKEILNQLAFTKAELEEAFGLVEEDDAKITIAQRLADLPQDEGDYNVSMDRGSVKFTIKLLEKDLHRIKTHVITTYEKTDPLEFKDPIMTKSYYVNKARKGKDILEALRIKLERTL